MDPAGKTTSEPLVTKFPATSRVPSVLSLLRAATKRFTVKVRLAPDSAVTTTVRMFEPVERADRPEIVTDEFVSVASAATETVDVPFGK